MRTWQTRVAAILGISIIMAAALAFNGIRAEVAISTSIVVIALIAGVEYVLED